MLGDGQIIVAGSDCYSLGGVDNYLRCFLEFRYSQKKVRGSFGQQSHFRDKILVFVSQRTFRDNSAII